MLYSLRQISTNHFTGLAKSESGLISKRHSAPTAALPSINDIFTIAHKPTGVTVAGAHEQQNSAMQIILPQAVADGLLVDVAILRYSAMIVLLRTGHHYVLSFRAVQTKGIVQCYLSSKIKPSKCRRMTEWLTPS